MKHYLFIFFVSFLQLAHGQFKKSDVIHVSWGAENRQEEKSNIESIYINSLGETYSIRMHNTTIILKKHDEVGRYAKTLTFDYESEIGKLSKFKIYYHSYFSLGDKIYIVTFEKDKTRELFYFKATPLNTLTMTTENPLLIHEMAFLNGQLLERLKIAVSPDESKIAIGFNEKGLSLDDINYGIKVFDNTFNELWQKELKGVGRSFFKSIDEKGCFSVTNEGIVTLFQKVKHEGSLFSTKGNDSDDIKIYNKFHVFAFTERAQTKLLIEIPVNNITQVMFKLTEQNQLIAGGFYSSALEGMNGTFFFRYNPETGETGTIKVNEFDKIVIKSLLSTKEQKTMEKKETKGKSFNLPVFQLNDMVETPSGDIKFISELYYTWQSISYDGRGNMRIVTHYVYDDILVLCFDKEGAYKWGTPIHKYQDATDGGYWNSYSYIFVGNDLLVVFADNTDNLTKAPDNTRIYNAHGKKGVFVGVKIDADGYADKGFLYEIRDVALFTICSISARTDSELVLYAEKGKKSKLVHFRLK